MPLIKFTIITLFPEALQSYLDSSMLFKAQKRGIIEIEYVNLRDFGIGPHKSVDDTPYGGGNGMLMRCETAFGAIESVKKNSPHAEVFLPTPVGEIWNQNLARHYAGLDDANAARAYYDGLERANDTSRGHTALSHQNTVESHFGASPSKISPSPRHYIILCPHYEGYDERIMAIVDHPISLGNYVLTGGELPALIIVDSVTRLLPGVLGGDTSADVESFSDGDNLEYPQYTKPADFRGMKVPDVLLSGDHGKVLAWRKAHTRRQGKTENSAQN